MKKRIVLLGALLGIFATQTDARWGDIAWVKIRNKTPWKLNLWWGGHFTYNNKGNSFVLEPYREFGGLVNKTRSERLLMLRASKQAMFGPLFAARPTQKTTGVFGEKQYFDIFETPKRSPFFPINAKGQIYKVLTLVEDVSGTGIRVKQSWPEIKFLGFGRKPYIEMIRARREIGSKTEAAR